ncbi:MAG: murein L,D-transpeptidase [Confluentimicrobium sp.]|jgi:lipoprotein-anchoring transpeptidase ErfK/SrfK|uniref:L,D-transpeptidase n=1 Tax=Actibacterium sp. TaxID=1872125 RepID=UPI00050F2C7F|nr:L,D-transpeptidase [Actibacterium sp.]KGB83531.1 hypothetical protein JT55_01830 [Rhodovulum sp. NI22]MBC56538.1 murein L,D-transpeptidase [Actibacterium sp.]MDY6858214.1 L,D-transpeptidase [Pseudomonadota bacterium]|tara:strand:- start:757 stop:1173 length:417 start_codon:yes stop_codon:yes gene_type:complete
MRRGALVLWLCLLPALSLAQAVTVRIDLSDQKMTVFAREEQLYEWPVSTAREGKCTPVGTFTPVWMTPFHRSTIYNGAAMPWSIFFLGNYAIHGTEAVGQLGAPASAGCIRLAPENAETLYHMVEKAGLKDTRVVIAE